jgi:hypothetical protein
MIDIIKEYLTQCKNKNIQDYNVACCSVWVWNLVVDIKKEKHRLRVFENRGWGECLD